ncbi:DUF4097 family beta strand repeat-containing protein [Nonomuraea sp. MCN248]|uniref:DUF4097 family beta strand repeat-containing protein n=1 Tax=Nonomuraea corallina TaxID=2989783 RepID=A0ABT4SDF1_9ACTN|nr:DUF4097 family beta strand repeat-containing protein [Nonomuraea corallina]MDA0635000.1 DUF4097 family beta strand repeat-containing protein [Nonomuraea corallina]
MTRANSEDGTMHVFDTPEPVLVVVELPTATVRINAGDRGDTAVEVRPSDESDETDVAAARRTEVEYADGRLLVRGDQETSGSLSIDTLMRSPVAWARTLLHGQGGSVEVTVSLPAGSRLDIRSAASLRCRGPLGEVEFATSYGDIQVEQAGRLRLKSTYGDISVHRASGHAEITSTHGDIRVGEIDGTALIRNSHGEIRLREITGDLRLTSAHSDATVDRALAGVTAKTAYGSLRVGEMISGSIVLETTGGGLELGIREGSSAWLDVSSRYGTVDVALDPSDGPAASDRVVEVRAHTAYGDITVHRS